MIHWVLIWLSKHESAILIIVTGASIIFALIWNSICVARKLFKFDINVLISIIVEIILWAIVKGICMKIAKNEEERAKLTDDYNSIVERYVNGNGDRFISVKNDCEKGKEEIIPVVIDAWLMNKTLHISDNSTEFYNPPQFVIEKYNKLLSAHSASSIGNSIVIRVRNWGFDDNVFELKTERTTYFNSLVTNRAMDYDLGNGTSVRSMFECGPCMLPLDKSLLSNHLGFNGFIETADHYIVLIKRKDKVSIGKDKWGNSVMASLKSKYSLNQKGLFTYEGLFNGMICEINDELGIKRDSLSGEMDDEKIQIIAAYRDYLEGGKPQLCVYSRTELNKKNVQKTIRDKMRQDLKTKHGKAKSLEENGGVLVDAEDLVFIHADDIRFGTKIFNDRIIVRGEEYSMLPSYSACVYMLREYLNNIAPIKKQPLYLK